jgi:hypothetical protein
MGDKPGSRSVKVSSSVTVRAKKGSPLKPSPGAEQARAQNARVLSKTTKAEAKANARGLKGANAPAKAKTVKMDNISKTATRIFGQTTTKGKPKSVKVGSKKEARLTAKETWAKNFEAKSDAKYEAQRALEAKKALIRARKYQ